MVTTRTDDPSDNPVRCRGDPGARPVHSDKEIEAAIIALGREPGGGLVVIPDSFTFTHRVSIILAAARNNVPAVYALSEFAREGGLLSYGPELVDISRRAATYVDRILRGAKPAELPVQLPIKYEMAVNLKTVRGVSRLGSKVKNPDSPVMIDPKVVIERDEVRATMALSRSAPARLAGADALRSHRGPVARSDEWMAGL
jgi:hypothetical protein